MRKKYLFGLLTVLILAVFPVSGCGSPDSANPSGTAAVSYQDISADQLKTMIDTDKNLLVVDVREKEEYDAGHIAGSMLLATSEFSSRVGELPKDKKIVLVCASGARSAQAAGYLVQQGYQDVYNLSGGLSAWPYDLVK